MVSRSFVAALLVGLAAAGCAGSPATEGYHIDLRFTSLDVSVIDLVRIAFRPDPMRRNDQRFMSVEPMSYEDGNIDLAVDADGEVTLEIDGDFVAARSEMRAALEYLFEVDVWSGDTRDDVEPPLVSVVATRGSDPIAVGSAYLPAWPPPLTEKLLIQVPCSSGARCQP